MKTIYSLLIAILTFITTQSVYAEWERTSYADWQTDINYQLGYRFDDFRWDVGFANHVAADFLPNVLSELHWKDLNSLQIGLECILTNKKSFYMRANGYYSWVFSGQVWDFDFFGRNRTEEVSRSISDANKSHLADFTFGVGRIFYHPTYCFSLAPLVGYSFHTQFLRMFNGRQIVPFTAPIRGLDSHYIALWNSAWVGVDLAFDSPSCWKFLASYELHFAFYNGRGHWNLRQEFTDDFKQQANGIGQVLALGLSYMFTDCFAISLTGKYQGWFTWEGKDTTFFIDPESGNAVRGELALNRVCWNSFSVMLGTNLSF